MDFDEPYEEGQGVLKRHAKAKTTAPKKADAPLPPPKETHAEGSDAEYNELENYFRQKFAQDAKPVPKKKEAPQPKAPRGSTKKPTQPDYQEMSAMYKTLLDQTLQGLKQTTVPTKKPLSEKQVARNEKARQQMLSYHASKKQATTTAAPTPKEEVKAEAKSPPPPPPVEKAPEVTPPPIQPTAIGRNFFADLTKRRRR